MFLFLNCDFFPQIIFLLCSSGCFSTWLLGLPLGQLILPQFGFSDTLLAIQRAIDGGISLQLPELHCEHTVARSLGYAQLESVIIIEI